MSTPLQDLIHRANQALLNEGKATEIPAFFCADYVVHIGERQGKGHGFIRRWLRQMRKAMPDLEVVKVEILAVAEDRVSWRRRLTGTHQHPLRGLPASGRRVQWNELLVSRFAAGRIAEEWAASELAAEMMLSLPQR